MAKTLELTVTTATFTVFNERVEILRKCIPINGVTEYWILRPMGYQQTAPDDQLIDWEQRKQEIRFS
jgi:hypothetical protein